MSCERCSRRREAASPSRCLTYRVCPVSLRLFPWSLDAVRLLRLDLERSVVVGDKWSDVALARAAGARGVLVRTGYGRS